MNVSTALSRVSSDVGGGLALQLCLLAAQERFLSESGPGALQTGSDSGLPG